MDDRSRPAAADVRAVRFREAFRGYDPRQVDRLLERVAQQLEAGGPLDWVSAERGFRRCFRGYAMAEVDAFLARLAHEDATAGEQPAAGGDPPGDDGGSPGVDRPGDDGGSPGAADRGRPAADAGS